MARRVDPLKAKQAKQKKIAIGGAVLLLALLAFQGPKTLKALQGPQPIPSASTAAPAPTAPAVPTDPTGAPAQPSTGEELAAVADSDEAPEPEQGQLATFERFATKDPFVQQALPKPAAPAPAEEAPSDADQEAPTGGAGAAPGGSGATGGFTTGGDTGSAPQQTPVAGATSIAVNGVAEDVALEATFPKDEPTFVLVSVAKNGKSVQIGIAGGQYAGGGETMTLAFGKKITLQNTADGSRYELELKAIQGFPVPKAAK
jgi:hypothetical protein